MSGEERPFWQQKSLSEMTETEWESLCDGCGRCCLVKLEEDLGAAEPNAPSPGTPDANPRVFFTDVGCRLLDSESCRCKDYENRTAQVPDCVRLTPAVLAEIGWLPPTCAYRLLAEGGDLPWWHPLVSGDPETVHAAGISVRGRVLFGEDELPAEELEDHIVNWPVRAPKRARAGGRGPGPSQTRLFRSGSPQAKGRRGE